MHTDADFLWAILADPFDDAPRLIYAEWLEDRAHESGGGERCDSCKGTGHDQSECENCGNRPDEIGCIEHGRGCYVVDSDGGGTSAVDDCDKCHGTGRIPDTQAARAEFIRVQCELFAYPIEKCDASYPGCILNPRMNAVVDHNRECPMYRLDKRVDELLKLHRNEWFESLLFARPFIGRGFIQAIDCTLAAFMQHAAEIFARHPVTEVRLTDREPSGRHIGWYGRTSQFTPDELPFELCDRLRDYVREAGDWRWYPTSDAAHAALSRACVDYGRSLAGLPPLTWPTMPANELSGISG